MSSDVWKCAQSVTLLARSLCLLTPDVTFVKASQKTIESLKTNHKISRCPHNIDRRDIVSSSGVPRNFVRSGGGGSTNSVEDRENGDLGAVAP